MTMTSFLAMRTTTTNAARRRAMRRCLVWGLGLWLLLASSPASAGQHDPQKDASQAPAMDVEALDPKVVAGAPPSLGGEALLLGGPSVGVTIEYYAYDGIGSMRMVFDPVGNVLGQATYSPFGAEIAGTTGMPAERFVGQARDHEAQLDYFGARAYQYRTGRFSTPDPGFSGPGDPQSWNRYGYALGNPLTFTDPDGLTPRFHDYVEVSNSGMEFGITRFKGPGGSYYPPSMTTTANQRVKHRDDRRPPPKREKKDDTQKEPPPENPTCTGDPVCGNPNDTDGVPGPESDGNATDVTEQTLAVFSLGRGLTSFGAKTVFSLIKSQQTVSLFRAMSSAELGSLTKGKFPPVFSSPQGTLQGKWFAESFDDAVKWGNQMSSWKDGAPFNVIRIDVPKAAADTFWRESMLDNIGPARFAELWQINKLRLKIHKVR